MNKKIDYELLKERLRSGFDNCDTTIDGRIELGGVLLTLNAAVEAIETLQEDLRIAIWCGSDMLSRNNVYRERIVVERNNALSLAEDLEDIERSYCEGGFVPSITLATHERFVKDNPVVPTKPMDLEFFEKLKASRQRLQKYLDRRKQSRGTVYEEIHGYDVSPDEGFVLLASDIETLIG